MVGQMAEPEVTILATRSCPYCKMESAYLEARHQSYREVFVEEDRQAQHQLMAVSHQLGVPVTIVKYPEGEERFFVGYQEDLLDKLIDGQLVGTRIDG